MKIIGLLEIVRPAQNLGQPSLVSEIPLACFSQARLQRTSWLVSQKTLRLADIRG